MFTQFVLLLLVVVASGMSVPVLHADITSREGELISKPATVKVVLGETVRVPLVAIRPAGSKLLSFRITTEPTFGDLGEIEADPTDTSMAWVVYRSKPGVPPGKDTFTFNVKMEGKNASISAPITVILEEPVAQLQVDPALAFGRVELGFSKTLPLKIKNIGTKTFVSLLRPPAPWLIAESQQNLVIKPGGSVTIDLTFEPTKLDPVRSVLPLQIGNPEGSVELSGMGDAAFTVPKSTLSLLWDPVLGERQGALRLSNETGRELPLRLTAEAPIRVEGLIVLQPKQVIEVPVAISGIEAFRGSVKIVSEHLQETVQVRAIATPAKLKVLKPETRVFDFELLDTDTPPIYEVVVMNEGGQKAYIYGQTSRPFAVVEGADPTELASGAQTTIKVSVDASQVGKYERKLEVLGTATEIEFELSAMITRNVDRASVGMTMPNLISRATPQEAALRNMQHDYRTRLFGVSERRRMTNATVPTVQKIYLDHQSQRKLVFSWDHPGSPDLDYELEVEVYDVEEGKMPKAVWHRATEHVTVKKDEKGAQMTLVKLQPGRQFRIRIVTINKDGHSSQPSRQVLVYTLPRTKAVLWYVVPSILVLGGAGFYLWRRRQYR